MFYISEIFESIQGEGNYSGVYSLFVRFHFCNLTCNWCDTKFTWNKKSGAFKEYSAEDLKKIVSDSKAQHIIFTGGEPALYRLDLLVVEGKKFHVETNGSIIPTEKLDKILPDGTSFQREAMQKSIIEQFNWVVSPKLSNSYQEFFEEAFLFWINKSYCIFKFIARDKNDLEEIDQLVVQYQISKYKVYIALEGFTLNSQLQPEMVDEIIRLGYNYSPRLQVLLWGSKRGK